MEKSYSYRASIQEITRIREDLEVLAGDWKLPGPVMSQVGVIVEELFSNIVRFGWEDPEGQEIRIGITWEEDSIRLDIMDHGRAFNPMEYRDEPGNDPVSPGSGGMGLTLVRAFATDIAYRREGGMNHLCIRKAIRKP